MGVGKKRRKINVELEVKSLSVTTNDTCKGAHVLVNEKLQV